MQQATGALINQAPRTTTESSTSIRSGALGALYGAAFCFLAATVVSIWAAYDGAVALNRFFLLLSGILAVMAAPLLGERLSLRKTAAGVTALSNLLVLGVALGYGLQRLGVVSPASGLAWLPSFSDNQAAQLLALGLPFTVASIWLGVSERRKALGGMGMVALLPGAAALALTASRGAWLGIAAAALVALYLFVRTALQQRTMRRSIALWLLDGLALLAVLALLGFYLAVVASPAFDAQVGASAQGGSALSRIALWRDSIPLIEDYFFTGSGLGATAMVYATYAYLLHVPYLYHAHNLYVQVALEQGAPALLAWLALVFATMFYAVNALRVAESVGRALVIAGLAALTALLIHGLFDAELYAGTLAALTFYAPAALLWSAASVYADAAEFQGREPASGIATGIGVLMGAGLPLLLALLLPGAPARWEANLGAVLQTRAELSRYRSPEWSFQDQVRRQETAALAPAETHFAAALVLDPTQPTAHRRLGAIALARGEFDRARDHLTVAYQVEPYDRATRQLLGEVLALDGDIAGAVRTWQGLDVGQGQFMVREWWYQAFGQPEQVEKLNDAVQAFERTE